MVSSTWSSTFFSFGKSKTINFKWRFYNAKFFFLHLSSSTQVIDTTLHSIWAKWNLIEYFFSLQFISLHFVDIYPWIPLLVCYDTCLVDYICNTISSYKSSIFPRARTHAHHSCHLMTWLVTCFCYGSSRDSTQDSTCKSFDTC